jgi:hypothetical protein
VSLLCTEPSFDSGTVQELRHTRDRTGCADRPELSVNRGSSSPVACRRQERQPPTTSSRARYPPRLPTTRSSPSSTADLRAVPEPGRIVLGSPTTVPGRPWTCDPPSPDRTLEAVHASPQQLHLNSVGHHSTGRRSVRFLYEVLKVGHGSGQLFRGNFAARYDYVNRRILPPSVSVHPNGRGPSGNGSTAFWIVVAAQPETPRRLLEEAFNLMEPEPKILGLVFKCAARSPTVSRDALRPDTARRCGSVPTRRGSAQGQPASSG